MTPSDAVWHMRNGQGLVSFLVSVPIDLAVTANNEIATSFHRLPDGSRISSRLCSNVSVNLASCCSRGSSTVAWYAAHRKESSCPG